MQHYFVGCIGDIAYADGGFWKYSYSRHN